MLILYKIYKYYKHLHPSAVFQLFTFCFLSFILTIIFTPDSLQAKSNLTFTILNIDQKPLQEDIRSLKRLALEIEKHTSVEVDLNIQELYLYQKKLYDHPMLVLPVRQPFSPLSNDYIHKLGRYLRSGGMLWIENNENVHSYKNDKSIRRLLSRIFPSNSLQALKSDNVLYSSFYLIRSTAGRLFKKPYIEGITVGKRLAVIYSMNDNLGAYLQNQFGTWTHRVDGGLTHRNEVFRLGINIVMYALCLDYKADQVHIPFILKRRQ